MNSFALDDSGFDLYFENGELITVEGAEAVRQYLRSKLKTFLGEWFVDRSVGIPYYEDIFLRHPDAGKIDSLFKEAILNCPGIVELISFDLSLDSVARVLTLSFSARTQDGIIDFSEAIP